MTTFHIPAGDQGQDLADALADTARFASPDALTALTELRVTADTGNRNTVAHVAWAEHEPLARALRACADSGHPLGDRLRGIADALHNNIKSHAMNNPGARHLVPAEPAPAAAPEPEPAPAPL